MGTDETPRLETIDELIEWQRQINAAESARLQTVEKMAEPPDVLIPFQVEMAVSTSDLDLIDTMLKAGGFTDTGDLVKVALWQYARHLQIGPVPPEFMELRVRLDRQGKPYRGKK